MKITKAIALFIITEIIFVSAAAPLGTAAVFAVSGAPGATELALDLYGNNSSKENNKSTKEKGGEETKGKEKTASKSKADNRNSNDKNSKDNTTETEKSGSAKKSADKSEVTITEASSETAAEISETNIPADSRHFAEGLTHSYVPADGKFTLTDKSRFYIVSGEMPSDEMLSTVSLIDSELAAYGIPSENPLRVVYGKAEKAEPGDIVIELVADEEFRPGITAADIKEAYILNLGETAKIEACGTDGVYYGLLTFLEMLREKQGGDDREEAANGMALDGAVISDGPELAERAVLLDCGRRYFSREWIENFIKRASLQRYNAIVMHFSEAEGLRLDSRVFPWLTKRSASLSMEEMAEIIRVARKYHVEIIPSLDMPGHNRYIVKRYAEYVSEHPEFSFECDGETYDSSIRGFASIANHWSNNGKTKKADYIGIDVTKKHAVAFMNALVDDYASFFAEMGCTDFDIGGDELLGWYSFDLGGEHFSFANRWKALDHWAKYAKDELGIKKGSASDTYVDFLNRMAERLEANGFTCRVFNDDLDINKNQHVRLNESIEVTYWFPANNSAKHFAKQGHRIHNFVENWCFYVLRKNNGKDIMTNKYKSVNAKNIYYNWDPREFTGSVNKGKTVERSSLAGGYFAIWCDHPDYKSDEKIWDETELRMWANASKMWNPEVCTDNSGIQEDLSYDDLKKFVKSMDVFPGYAGKPDEDTPLPDAAEPEAVRSWWQELISF